MRVPDGTGVTALDGPMKGWCGRVYTNTAMRKDPIYICVRHDLTVTEGFAFFLRTYKSDRVIQSFAEELWRVQHGDNCKVPQDLLMVISDLESPLIKLELSKKHRRGKRHKMRSGL